MTLRQCYALLDGDYEGVLGRMRKESLVEKFVLKFLNDPSMDALRQGIAAKDRETAFRAAHTIKGVCMNLAITKLFESSNKLTETLRGRSEYGEDIEPLLAQVKEDYALTLDCIRALQ